MRIPFRSVPIPALLERLGIKATRRGGKWVAPCPSPDHEDHDPSWFIRDDPGTEHHGHQHCFSCKFGGGVVSLVEAVLGLETDEAKRVIEQVCGLVAVEGSAAVPRVVIRRPAGVSVPQFSLPSGVVIPSLQRARWNAAALSYLHDRGVTGEQIARWSIGYATRGRLAWRIVFPVYDGDDALIAYSARVFVGTGPRYKFPDPRREPGCFPERAMFGEHLWEPALGVVTIAEGAFSALALERAGAPNGTGLLGSNLGSERIDRLSRWSAVLVATDPDEAGEKAARSALAALGRRATVVRVRLPASPDDAAPEALRAAVREALDEL